MHDFTEGSLQRTSLGDSAHVICLSLCCYFDDGMLDHLQVVLARVVVVHAIRLWHLVLIEGVLAAIVSS